MAIIGGIDLHLHTTRSDGRYGAAELIEIVRNAGVGTMAVTDHDTLLGYRDARKHATEAGIRLCPGIEISTSFKASNKFVEEVHILWYGMDADSLDVIRFESDLRRTQNNRAAVIVSKLSDIGYELDFDEMLNAVDPAPVCLVPMILQLIGRGRLPFRANAINEFVVEYLGPGGKAYEPPAPELPNVLNELKELGGISVLAHPGKIRDARVIESVLNHVNGIEVFYPAHSSEETENFKALADERGLLVTAGSDFHGYYESEYLPPVISEVGLKELERFIEAVRL